MAIAGVFGFGGLALANELTGPIDVKFQKTPLFTEANFIPGDSVSRTVDVENQDGAPQGISMKFYGVDNGDNLASRFNFKIKKGGDTVYSDDLDKAFDQNQIVMNSSLAAGGSETYDFILSFDKAADNDYQSKEMGFSICVGFAGESFCVSDQPQPQTYTTITGGGGGGISGDKSIIISAREIKTFCLENGMAAAAIYWNTDIDAVARVLYVPAGNGFKDPFNAADKPNYGYNSTFWETESRQTHLITISDLTPGQTYAYRLDIKSADGKKRLTTQAFETFTARGCVKGAATENFFEIPTGILGSLSDQEIKDIFARISNSDYSGNTVAAASDFSAPPVAQGQVLGASDEAAAGINWWSLWWLLIVAFGLIAAAMIFRHIFHSHA